MADFKNKLIRLMGRVIVPIYLCAELLSSNLAARAQINSSSGHYVTVVRGVGVKSCASACMFASCVVAGAGYTQTHTHTAC